MDGRYLRTRDAAAYLGISHRTLEDLRLRGGGPRYSTPRPRVVVYDREDLDRWIARGARTSTSDPGPAPDRAA
jgi:hypothetical protein